MFRNKNILQSIILIIFIIYTSTSQETTEDNLKNNQGVYPTQLIFCYDALQEKDLKFAILKNQPGWQLATQRKQIEGNCNLRSALVDQHILSHDFQSKNQFFYDTMDLRDVYFQKKEQKVSLFTKSLRNFQKQQIVPAELVDKIFYPESQNDFHFRDKNFFKLNKGNPSIRKKNPDDTFWVEVSSFIASVDPYLTFSQVVQLRVNNEKTRFIEEVTLTQLRKFCQNSSYCDPEQVDITLKEMKERISVIHLALHSSFAKERVKMFQGLNIQFQLDLEFKNIITTSFKFENIFQSYTNIQNSQINKRTPAFNQKTRFVKDCINVIGFIVKEYKEEYGLDLTQVVKKLNRSQLGLNDGFDTTIHHQKGYYGIDEQKINFEYLDQYLKNKTTICHHEFSVFTDFVYNQKFFDAYTTNNCDYNYQAQDIFLNHILVNTTVTNNRGKKIELYDEDRQVKAFATFNYKFDNKTLVFDYLKEFDQKNIYSVKSSEFLLDQVSVNFMNPDTVQNFLSLQPSDYIGKSWIYKPDWGQKGEDLVILQTLEEAQEHAKQKLEQASTVKKVTREWYGAAYQIYLRDIALISNMKFDIRNYLTFVFRGDGSTQILYNPGFVRKTMTEYDKNSCDLSVGLTNTSKNRNIRKKNVVSFYEDSMALTPEDLEAYLQEQEDFTQERIDEFNHTVKKTLSYIGQTFLQKYPEQYKDTYIFFGTDLLVDNEWRPYFLEGNTAMGMYRDVQGQFTVKNRLIKDIYNIEEQMLQKKSLVGQPGYELDYKNTDFILLYDSNTGYDYLADYKN